MTVGQQILTVGSNLFGFDSLLLLALKTATPIFTITYYFLMEDYTSSEVLYDGFPMFFLELVVSWHFLSRLIRSLFEIDRKAQGTIVPFLVVTALLFIGKMVWAIWFTAGIERQYGFVKHLFIILYILLQLVSGTNLGEMSQDFWYFVADTVLLSQICAIYFLNELNFSIFNSFSPIILSLLSFLLVRGLSVNNADKTQLCLVKTIGKHDAVFLILLYALVVLILTVIDFFANSYWAGFGAVFFLHALVIFPGLMENKLAVAYVTSSIMVLGMISLQVYLMSVSQNPYPRDTVKPETPLEGNSLVQSYEGALRSVLGYN